jgi:hypothetical protein
MMEFLVAFFPLLLLFLCCLELARFGVARLMVQRAAGIAVRACAVIKDQPAHCDANTTMNNPNGPVQNPGEDGQILLAAQEALRPFDPQQLRIDSAACDVKLDAVGGDTDNHGTLVPTHVAQSGTDTLTATATFLCVIPLARDIVCPGHNSTRTLSALAQFGHQGARYDCWYARTLKIFWPPDGKNGYQPFPPVVDGF